MNSPVEERLRQALAEAGATIDTSTLRPLQAPERRGFRVDFRLVAVAVTVVVGLAAAAVGLGGPEGEDRVVAADPGPTESNSSDMAIFLCTKSAPKETPCQGRDASAEEIKAIEQKVMSLPQLKAAFFESRARAYKNFLAEFAGNKAVLEQVKATDLPDSYRLVIKEGADRQQVSRALVGVAGVLSVIDEASFPDVAPKVDVSVFLCHANSTLPSCGAEVTSRGKIDMKVIKEGKGATKAQKMAIEKLIKEMPEVESVFFEDQATAYENFRRAYKEKKALVQATKVEDMPEAFRLKLKPGTEPGKLISKLRQQPGVSQVVDTRCQADLSKLLAHYGVTKNRDNMCP